MICARACLSRVKGKNSWLTHWWKSYPMPHVIPCRGSSPGFFVDRTNLQSALKTTLKSSQKDVLWYHTETVSDAYGGIPYNPKSNIRIPRKDVECIDNILEENYDKIHTFATVLGCSDEEFCDLVRKDTRIVTSFKETKVKQTISLLKKYGFEEKEILSNPPAFCLSIRSLEMRLKEMKSVRCDKLYVLKYGRKKFLEILEYYENERQTMKGFVSRETFLAALFGREEPEILQKGDDFPHILTYSVRRLVDAYNLVIEYSFSTEDIWGDLDTLVLPPTELKYRLDKMNAVGIVNKENVFPLLHYIRKDQFEGSVKCWVEDQTALDGHEDKTSFLCWRLGCQPKDVKRMYMLCPVLKSTRPKRLKAVLDILLDDMGVPGDVIVFRPTVFVYSTKRLQFRHSVLSEHSITDPNAILDNLFLSEEKFARKYDL